MYRFGLSGYCPHYAMLVVSAYTGTSAMSEEHLSLARALELPLVIVLTKVDLVTPKQLANTMEKLKNTLDYSTDQNPSSIPIFQVSSVTGQGLSELKDFLFKLTPATKAGDADQDVEFQVS